MLKFITFLSLFIFTSYSFAATITSEKFNGTFYRGTHATFTNLSSTTLSVGGNDVLKSIPALYAADSKYAGGMKCDFDGTNGTDDTAALNAVVGVAATGSIRRIILPSGRCKITVPTNGVAIQLNTPGLEFHGQGGYRPETRGGTSIDAVGGPGVVFQNGTDNGHAWDANDYDGPQFVTFKDLIIRYRGTNLTLGANGIAQYGTGVTGVKDWRGGDIRIINSAIELFEYGFWGINSDFSSFQNVKLNYNHVAAYFGPRSDQLDLQEVSGFYNDTLLWLDGTVHANLNHINFTFNGSPTTPPLKISSSAWSYLSDGTVCNMCWFENGAGQQEGMNNFIDIGIGDSSVVKSVVIKNPTLINSVVGQTTNVPYLARIENAGFVSVENITNTYGDSLVSYFNTIGTTSPILSVWEFTGSEATNINTNSGSGTPIVLKLSPTTANTLRLEGALTTTGTIQSPALFTYKNTDAAISHTFRSGDTVDQNELLIFQDRTGSTKYSLGYVASGGLFVINDADSYSRFLVNGPETRLQVPSSGYVGLRNSAGVEVSRITDTGAATLGSLFISTLTESIPIGRFGPSSGSGRWIFQNAGSPTTRVQLLGYNDADALSITLDPSTGIGAFTGKVTTNGLNVGAASTPASAAAACTIGDRAWDASYIYQCVDTNTWKRTAITTW